MTLQKALARLTYKPGWAFGVDFGRLFVVFDTFDATSKRLRRVQGEMVRPVPLRLVHQVNRGRTRGFYDWIAKLLREREEHEVREWLKVDGKHMVDPHPELRP